MEQGASTVAHLVKLLPALPVSLRTPVQVSSVPLPIQLSGKSSERQSKYLGRPTHVRDLNEALGSWVQTGPTLAVVPIWSVKTNLNQNNQKKQFKTSKLQKSLPSNEFRVGCLPQLRTPAPQI